MRMIALLTVISLSSAALAEETPAAKKYRALLNQYEQEGGARTFAKRFLALAVEQPRDAASADALLWVVRNVRGRPDTTRSLELLMKHHVSSDKLGSACKSIADSRSVAAEKLLRATLEKNPDKQVRAQSCYYLALLLDLEANLIEQLKSQPELTARVLQYYGEEYGKHLSSLDPGKLTVVREQVYQQLLTSFADVEMQDNTMGAIAKKALFAIRRLSVGRVAPEIQGEDIHGKRFKLSDYRGKVVMLSFWGHW